MHNEPPFLLTTKQKWFTRWNAQLKLEFWILRWLHLDECKSKIRELKLDEMSRNLKGGEGLKCRKLGLDCGGYSLDKLRRGDSSLIRIPTQQVSVLSCNFGVSLCTMVRDWWGGMATEKLGRLEVISAQPQKFVRNASLPIAQPLEFQPQLLSQT